MNDGQNIEIAWREYPVDDRIGQAGNRELARVFDAAFPPEKRKTFKYLDDLPDAG